MVAVLFVSAIAGTILYYSGKVSSENSKITSQNNEIANLTDQISNLTTQISNLTTANLVTSLVVTENLYFPSYSHYLSITGTVNNTGEGIAYNAGLNVVAYSEVGTEEIEEINMTVPLTINSWVPIGSSLPLGNLAALQSATVYADIYHFGDVTNWTITPVWTNMP